MLMYYVYILKSKKDSSLYKGMTADLRKRLEAHNSGCTTFSSSKRPYEIVWYCAFMDKRKALDFEKYLKHGSGHAFTIKHLI